MNTDQSNLIAAQTADAYQLLVQLGEVISRPRHGSLADVKTAQEDLFGIFQNLQVRFEKAVRVRLEADESGGERRE